MLIPIILLCTKDMSFIFFVKIFKNQSNCIYK